MTSEGRQEFALWPRQREFIESLEDTGRSSWFRYIPDVGWGHGEGFCRMLDDNEIYADRWL